MANLFLLSFLVVAGGIVFLLYGPARRGRPIIAVPRASLARLQPPRLASPVAPAPVPEPPETVIAEDLLVPEPPPSPPPAPPRVAVAPPPPRIPVTPPPRPHGFVPVVNSKGPLPPLRGRAARGTDSPRRAAADTRPTASRDFTNEEATYLDTTRPHRP